MGRAESAGCDADVGSCWPASVRYRRLGNNSYGLRRNTILPKFAEHADPSVKPDAAFFVRPTERRSSVRFSDEPARRSKLAKLHIPLHPYAAEPETLRNSW